jgi:inhibitor of cysteine peptidase
MNVTLQAACMVFWGALATASCAMDTPPSELKLTQADHDSAVSVDVGATISVELEAIAGTGYGWQLQPMSNDVLHYDSAKTTQAKAQPGAAQTTHLRFRAVSTGESVLQLHYARPWEKEKPPLREFTVRVRVNPAKARD